MLDDGIDVSKLVYVSAHWASRPFLAETPLIVDTLAANRTNRP